MILDKNNNTSPFVSIIIPLKNEEKYIELCLKSLISQQYSKDCFEIIVVDNGSTDKSLEIVKKYNVKIIYCLDGNIAKVRNVGTAAAKGEILAFVDSDCVVSSNWLTEGVNILNRPKVVATGSGYKAPHNATWVENAWLIESKVEERFVKFVPCGNFIVKASIFHEIGGFNETLVTCEDADICERIVNSDYLIINSTKIESVHLRNPKKIIDFMKKEIWYGSNMLSSLQNNIIDKTFIFTTAFYLSHIMILLSLVWRTPFLYAGFILLQLLINAATIHRLVLSKKYKLYFHTLLLYYFYFLARSVGVTIGIFRIFFPLKN